MYVSAFPIIMRAYFSSIFSLLLLLLLGACTTPSQRAISSIKSALKSKKTAEAFRLVEAGRKDTLLMNNATLYHLGVESSRRMYDKENEKLYLRRNADTLALFRHLYHIYDYALLTDSVAQNEANSSPTANYRKVLAETMTMHFSNLNAASLYFLRKQNWEEAVRYAEMGVRVCNSSIWKQFVPQWNNTQSYSFAWRHLLASYQLKQYTQTLRYASQALSDTTHRATTLEILVRSHAALAHHEEEKAYLKRGVQEYPRIPFFFVCLAEHYFQQNQPDEVLAMTEQLLHTDSTNLLLREERARAYYLKADYQKCLQAAETILQRDTTYAQAYYYKGYAYLQLGKAIDMPLSLSAPGYKAAFQRQRDHYKNAQKALEIYRRLSPIHANIWAPLLYEIYLKLNLGKEFEEISRHLPQ